MQRKLGVEINLKPHPQFLSPPPLNPLHYRTCSDGSFVDGFFLFVSHSSTLSSLLQSLFAAAKEVRACLFVSFLYVSVSLALSLSLYPSLSLLLCCFSSAFATKRQTCMNPMHAMSSSCLLPPYFAFFFFHVLSFIRVQQLFFCV